MKKSLFVLLGFTALLGLVACATPAAEDDTPAGPGRPGLPAGQSYAVGTLTIVDPDNTDTWTFEDEQELGVVRLADAEADTPMTVDLAIAAPGNGRPFQFYVGALADGVFGNVMIGYNNGMSITVTEQEQGVADSVDEDDDVIPGNPGDTAQVFPLAPTAATAGGFAILAADAATLGSTYFELTGATPNQVNGGADFQAGTMHEYTVDAAAISTVNGNEAQTSGLGGDITAGTSLPARASTALANGLYHTYTPGVATGDERPASSGLTGNVGDSLGNMVIWINNSVTNYLTIDEDGEQAWTLDPTPAE